MKVEHLSPLFLYGLTLLILVSLFLHNCGVQDMAVIIGEQVTFPCSSLRNDSEVDIIWWTVDGTVYKTCPPQGGMNICFENSINDTTTAMSNLIITDSSSLGIGSHTVQCIVQRGSFGTELFNETSTASLYIHPGESLHAPSLSSPFPLTLLLVA